MKPSERITEIARDICATPGGPDDEHRDKSLYRLAVLVQAIANYLDEQDERLKARVIEVQP